MAQCRVGKAILVATCQQVIEFITKGGPFPRLEDNLYYVVRKTLSWCMDNMQMTKDQAARANQIDSWLDSCKTTGWTQGGRRVGSSQVGADIRYHGSYHT